MELFALIKRITKNISTWDFSPLFDKMAHAMDKVDLVRLAGFSTEEEFDRHVDSLAADSVEHVEEIPGELANFFSCLTFGGFST